MSRDKWSPSLKNYVHACFEKCRNEVEKDEVEIILKEMLLQAYNDGSMFTSDWSKHPLPRTHSERLEEEKNRLGIEQKKAALSDLLSKL